MTRLRIVLKVFVFLISIACAALFLVPIENRILWGYWILPPTLKDELRDINVVFGVSRFKVQTEGVSIWTKDRKRTVSIEELFFMPEAEQFQKPLLSVLESIGKSINTVPEIDNSILSTAWKITLNEGWMPKITEPQYKNTGLPFSGLAIHFQKGNEDKVLISYYTGEFSNDRHGYAEVLYKINGSQVTLLRQIHFFFEVAGLEGLTWKVLWILNSGFILICLSVILSSYFFMFRKKKDYYGFHWKGFALIGIGSILPFMLAWLPVFRWFGVLPIQSCTTYLIIGMPFLLVGLILIFKGEIKRGKGKSLG